MMPGHIRTLLFIAVFLTLTGCFRVNDGKEYRRHVIAGLMDSAQTVLNDDPEQAFQFMDSIDSRSIKGRERKALYALLYSETLYKNGIDVDSDSLIMIAVRHYSIGKDILKRFRSYYTLGCIYNQMGRYTDAAVALSEAEESAEYINDGFRLGLLYSQLGEVFIKSFDFLQAKSYFNKAYDFYSESGKDVYKYYALYDIASCQMDLHDFKCGDSLMMIVEKWASDHEYIKLQSNSLLSRFSCSLYMNNTDSSEVMYKRYISEFGEFANAPFSLGLLSMYFMQKQDFDSASIMLARAWGQNPSVTDSVNLFYYSSQLKEKQGYADSALYYSQAAMSLQNNNLSQVLRQPVVFAQKEYFKSLTKIEKLKNGQNKVILVSTIVVSILVILLMVIYHNYHVRQFEFELAETRSVIDELTKNSNEYTRIIDQLKGEILSHKRKSNEITNHLYSVYSDSKDSNIVMKHQLTIIVNELKDIYLKPENIAKLDAMINKNGDGFMERLKSSSLKLSEREMQIIRFSLARFSLKAISVMIGETSDNVYQMKSRLMKKMKAQEETLWIHYNNML